MIMVDLIMMAKDSTWITYYASELRKRLKVLLPLENIKADHDYLLDIRNDIGKKRPKILWFKAN